MKIKRILAGGLAALMVGATLAFGAVGAGAGLSDYVTTGTDGELASPLIVVGADRSTTDTIAAADIAAAVAGYATTTVTTDTGEVSIINGVDIATTNNKIYLDDPVNSARDTLTKTNLPEILAQGKVTISGVDYTYDQYINLGEAQVTFGNSGGDLSEPELYLNGEGELYTATIVFNKELDITEADGKTITLFGNEYTIGQSTSDSIVLYSYGLTKNLASGEPVTLSIGGTEYTVEVDVFEDEKILLSVNNVNYVLEKGDSDVLEGLNVYVKDVLYSVNKSLAIISFGTDKLTISNGKVELGSEAIDDVTATIYGNVSKITVTVTPEDPVLAGSSYTDPVFGTFKVVYNGLTPALDSELRDTIVVNSANTKATIKFTDYRGYEDTFTFAYVDSGAIKLGESEYRQLVTTNDEVTENDYVIIGPGVCSEFNHILQLTDINNNEFTLRDVMSGVSSDYYNGTFYIDGYAYTANIDGENITFSDVQDNIVANGGECIVFNPTNVTVVQEEDSNGNEVAITVNMTVSGDEITVKPVGLTMISLEDSDISKAVTVYGTLVTYDSNDDGKVTIAYPDEQAYATIVMGSDPEFTTTVTTEVPYKITKPVARFASEINSENPGADLILVGGPCANKLVAELADKGYLPTCEAWDWDTKGIIKEITDAFTDGSKALIVAGTLAQDTRDLAAEVMQGVTSYSG